MASADGSKHDALLLLRQSIASDTPVVPTISESPPSSPPDDLSLASAKYLHFSSPGVSIPVTTPTRFFSSKAPVDLRSIYFAWVKREVAIPDYIAAALAFNAELNADGAAGGQVQNLAFVERLDLITWLEGASEDSEYIRPLGPDTARAATSAQVASGAAGGIAPVASAGARNRTIDPRLQEIYNGERRMGDRNSVLRGVKPTDFSHVRKIAQTFIGRKPGTTDTRAARTTALPLNPKPGRRPDPIILVSPSASSLLRMSNIKAFLEGGAYVPPEPSLASSAASSSILHLARIIPSIDSTRPVRFIVVDSPEQFKPEYWARVVAVFTTGQTWQFKNYKWQAPAELFRHALGVYVGWRGEPVPDAVRGWGRGVLCVPLDPWSGGVGSSARWRDREGVEAIWRGVEENMRVKGWSKDSGPLNG